MGVLAGYRRAAARAGVRVCRTTALHPAAREALDRARLMDLFEAVGSAESSAAPGPSENGARKRCPNVDDVQRAHRIVWGQLVALESEVETLLWRARQVGASCRTFACLVSPTESVFDYNAIECCAAWPHSSSVKAPASIARIAVRQDHPILLYGAHAAAT